MKKKEREAVEAAKASVRVYPREKMVSVTTPDMLTPEAKKLVEEFKYRVQLEINTQ